VKTLTYLLRALTLTGLLMSSVLLAHQPATARGNDIPAECTTKTPINPRTPGWMFVMNFEKVVNGAPLGCIVLIRDLLRDPVDFAPVTCKLLSNGADAVFENGRATLSGGYLYCPVNVKATLVALTPSITIPDVDIYPYFSIIAVANPTRTLQTDPTQNPLGYYVPENPAYPHVGMNLPMSGGGGFLVSTFNGVTQTGTFTNAFETTKEVTVLAEHDRVGGSFTMTHYLFNQPVEAFTSTAVNFYTNGGAFWIGTLPGTDIYYNGTLDEVIFDPPDGGRPPSSPTRYRIYFPGLQR